MSCLFDSFCHFVQQSSNSIRQTICDYLETNPKLIDDLSFNEICAADNIDPKVYIETMRQHSTCGGAIELRAFVSIYNFNVYIHSTPNNRVIEFVKNKDRPWIKIQWTGG